MGPAPAREDRASSSRERSTSGGRGAARSSSRESGRGVRGRGRPARPSPSPSGGRAPRFDPTAFVKAKEKKQREIRVKQQQQRHRLGSGGSGDGPSVSWSDPASSRCDRPRGRRERLPAPQLLGGQLPQPLLVGQLLQRVRGLLRVAVQRPPPRPREAAQPLALERVQPAPQKSTPQERPSHQRRLASSGGWVSMKECSSDYRGADMADIDARLKALQEYMNRLDTQS